MKPIESKIQNPKSKIGSGNLPIVILGGGQLGAMLSQAGRQMGFHVTVVSEHADDPAGKWCDRHVVADPSDSAAALKLFRPGMIVTVEAESVSPETLAIAEDAGAVVTPSAAAQRVVRDRRLEKKFVLESGLECGPFRIVESAEAMVPAFRDLMPANADTRGVVAKIASGGYDGRGQQWMRSEAEARAAWPALGWRPLLLEQAVPFVAEASVVVARTADDRCTTLPVFRNEHRAGILYQTCAGGALLPDIEARATAAGVTLSRKLGVVGLLAVEMFVLRDGRVWINEMAARPHNSGHLSLRACTQSQFELHIAAIAGLPLAPTDLLRPAVMTNLLGDLWRNGSPDFSPVFESGLGTLHLYGKSPRPGRKMGHMIHTAATLAEAKSAADACFAALRTAAE